MSERPVELLLQDIREALGKTERYLGTSDKEAFMTDEKTVDAVIRNLTVIGEAARRLPDQFKAEHGEIDWQGIIGLRNRIVHDYAGIDLVRRNSGTCVSG